MSISLESAPFVACAVLHNMLAVCCSVLFAHTAYVATVLSESYSATYGLSRLLDVDFNVCDFVYSCVYVCECVCVCARAGARSGAGCRGGRAWTHQIAADATRVATLYCFSRYDSVPYICTLVYY